MGDNEIVWKISENHKKILEHSFYSLKPINNKINGLSAKTYFLNSKLSKDVLATIWGICDTDKDGELNKKEFYCASLLVESCRSGNELPKSLPPTLVACVNLAIVEVARTAPITSYDKISEIFSSDAINSPVEANVALNMAPGFIENSGDCHSRISEYMSYFNSLKSPQDNLVSGKTARIIFLKTGLSHQILAKIWENSDLDCDGFLNQEEFINAMGQIDKCLSPKIFNPFENSDIKDSGLRSSQIAISSQNSADISQISSSDLHKSMLTSKFVTRKLDKILKLVTKDINNNENVLSTLQISEKQLVESINAVNDDIDKLETLHEQTLAKIEGNKQKIKRMSSSTKSDYSPTSQHNSARLKGPANRLGTAKKQSNSVDINLKNKQSPSVNVTKPLTDISYTPISEISVVKISDSVFNIFDDQEEKPTFEEFSGISPKNHHTLRNSRGRNSTSSLQAGSKPSATRTSKASPPKSTQNSKSIREDLVDLFSDFGMAQPTNISQSKKPVDLFTTSSPPSQPQPNNLPIEENKDSFIYTESSLCLIKRKGLPNQAESPTPDSDFYVFQNKNQFKRSDSKTKSLFYDPPHNLNTEDNKLFQENLESTNKKSSIPSSFSEKFSDPELHDQKSKNPKQTISSARPDSPTIKNSRASTSARPPVPNRPKGRNLQSKILQKKNEQLQLQAEKSSKIPEQKSIEKHTRAMKTQRNSEKSMSSHSSTIIDNSLNSKAPLGPEYLELDSRPPGLSPLLYHENEGILTKQGSMEMKESESSTCENEDMETYDPPLQAVAVLDFTSSATSLSFKTNEKVFIMFRSKEFFYTEINDIGDWFPTECVKIEENGSDEENSLLGCCYNLKGLRIAVYENVPEGSGEIEFKIDDVIMGEIEVDQDWLKGYANGMLGIYPKVFTKSLDSLIVTDVCIAAKSFSPTNKFELPISPGDSIGLLHKNSNGWCIGASQKNEKVGFFHKDILCKDSTFIK